MMIPFIHYSLAQTADREWNAGIHGGLHNYYGDMGNGFYKFDKALYGFGGITVSKYLSPHFDLNLAGMKGELGYYKTKTELMRASIVRGELNLRYRFFSCPEAIYNPYLLAGLGVIHFDDRFTIAETDIDFVIPSVGAGIQIRIFEDVYFQLQEQLHFTNSDNKDYIEKDANEKYLSHRIGFTVNIGKIKDADNDGIANRLDKCPATPEGVTVDPAGCPVDKDGDGIPNYQDACPSLSGPVSTKGCPDADGDGIPDYKDDCPANFGPAAFKGCPDKDGDGIIDKNDKCPDIVGVEKYTGCPDTDGDGIPDPDDKCPGEKGLANFNGCPDTDNDGIPDKDDKCPTEAGIKENRGCPEIKEEVKKVFTQALKGIQFETGKDIIKSTSFGILNNVVQIMKDNSEYKLNIIGHTDNMGDETKNLVLSEKRALSVMKYLVDKGIDASRLKSKGFGETQPVASNDNAAGRSMNRRVEFVVEF